MHLPLNRSDSQICPTGIVTFPPDATFANNTMVVTGVVGAHAGDVVCASVISNAPIGSGYTMHANCPSDGIVLGKSTGRCLRRKCPWRSGQFPRHRCPLDRFSDERLTSETERSCHEKKAT